MQPRPAQEGGPVVARVYPIPVQPEIDFAEHNLAAHRVCRRSVVAVITREDNMIAPSLAVAIATTTLLLGGCQTHLTTDGYLEQAHRDPTHVKCDDNDDCWVMVDPYKPQMVAEYIEVYPGRNFFLRLPEGLEEFDRPGFKLKDNVPADIECPAMNKHVVMCKLNNKPTQKEYAYRILVKGKKEYDPFVWPR